jgi:hypothetical protein
MGSLVLMTLLQAWRTLTITRGCKWIGRYDLDAGSSPRRLDIAAAHSATKLAFSYIPALFTCHKSSCFRRWSFWFPCSSQACMLFAYMKAGKWVLPVWETTCISRYWGGACLHWNGLGPTHNTQIPQGVICQGTQGRRWSVMTYEKQHLSLLCSGSSSGSLSSRVSVILPPMIVLLLCCLSHILSLCTGLQVLGCCVGTSGMIWCSV